MRAGDGHGVSAGNPRCVRIFSMTARSSIVSNRGSCSWALPIEHFDNFGGKNSFELLRVRVFVPEIAEHVSASPHNLQLFFHRNISFNLFSRFSIYSTSRFGVLIPCVDFFWNAWTTQISSASCTA